MVPNGNSDMFEILVPGPAVHHVLSKVTIANCLEHILVT